MQPLVDRRFGRPIQEPLRLGNVRVGALHIARLGGQLLDFRFDVHRLRDAGNEVLELRRLRPAEVDDFVLGGVQPFRPTETADDAIDDVANERVVAARRPVPVHGDRLVGEELPGKLVDRQVRPLARAVDGKEAQAVRRDVIEVVERVRQQLAGAFRGGVRRDRLAHRVGLGKGDLVVVAVDGRGGAVDERVDAQLLRHLEHRLRAAHIGLLVGHRRLDGGPYARPGREMDNRIHAPGVEGVQDGIGVADFRLDEREPLAGEVLNALLLHGARVEGIEVVDGRDAVAVVEEAATEVPADEAGTAGDADVHSEVGSWRRVLEVSLGSCKNATGAQNIPIPESSLAKYVPSERKPLEHLIWEKMYCIQIASLLRA